MSKELEALEKFLDDYLTLCEKLHTNRQENMLLDKNSPYNVLKTYLEFINNSDSSEALEAFGRITLHTEYDNESTYDELQFEDDCKLVYKALLKAEKDEKIILGIEDYLNRRIKVALEDARKAFIEIRNQLQVIKEVLE